MLYKLRYPATCPKCSRRIPAGGTAEWDRRFGVVSCMDCRDREYLTGRYRPAKVVEAETTNNIAKEPT